MTGAWWRRTARAALGRRTRLRWVHLVLGGALLMPYFLLASVVLSAIPGANPFRSLGWQLITYAVALPPAAVTALFPLVRTLEATAARSLCGLPASAELATAPATSWDARSRTSIWYVLHLAVGGLVSAVTLALPPAALLLLFLPFAGASEARELGWPTAWDGAVAVAAPAAGLLLLAVVVATAVGAGALLARCAPGLLGAVPAERLAAAEARAARLASRNRLARELHDSVGHALSAVTLQASAARKVLDADPEFARQALAAIEETSRGAVGELDTVLGLLRDGGDGAAAATTPSPTLADLDGLLDRTRAAGVSVELTAPGPLGALPAVVSREAYRIVQEGLSNALRHAGQVPVRLRIAWTADEADEDGPRKELEISMENPVDGTAREQRTGGGRGLRGIAERTALLRGVCAWGPDGVDDEVWRLSVRLPLEVSR
ncbi:sensor histidine kinase [Streptomyces cucumeris]|uniref:sensor histidine kinase n=1 Tax=Streptomyces cucumeris TaxID=2962890 RepID=UPI003EBEC829